MIIIHPTSCVRVGNQLSPWSVIASGIRQVCVIAPDLFVTGMDCLLERSVEKGTNGTTFGQQSFTDLHYADDVSVLAELLELLLSVGLLQVLQKEVAIWSGS